MSGLGSAVGGRLSSDDTSFVTPRLNVAEWHSVVAGNETGANLPQVVQALLTPAVTVALPEPWHGSYSESRARSWIRDRDIEGVTLLVTSRDFSQPIGLLLLHEVEEPDAGDPELRLGYLIAEPHWGQGYATELVRGLVEWARKHSYGSIVAGVSADNEPSRRVLERCGFLRIDDGNGSEQFYRCRL